MNTRKLLEFIRSQRLAVQASGSPAGRPQAAIVGFAVTDRFEIVFDTLQTTRKVQNLRKNAHIALVIGGWLPGDERTVQYEGEADEPSGAELERLKQVLLFGLAGRSQSRRMAWPDLYSGGTKMDQIQRLQSGSTRDCGVQNRRSESLK